MEKQLTGIERKILTRIKQILKETLKPGTDKGSPIAVIDVNNFEAAALAIMSEFKLPEKK